MELRDYQAAAIDQLWAWFLRHPDGHPVMDCCVSSGKSLMIASTIQRAITEYPETRVLMLVHQKELLVQNRDKLQAIYPDADIGIYSAALGFKQLDHRITLATIGSVYKHAHLLGRLNLIMADEAHLISTKAIGMWRTLIADLKRYGNADIRVVGWTGSPFRNGGVFITAGEQALFTGIAARVSMSDMLKAGYLTPLVPVPTVTKIDTSQVKTAAGDYVINALAAASDKTELVNAACDEIVRLAHDRRRWLIFCVTVEHAQHVNDALQARGVASAVVLGSTPSAARDAIFADYQADKLRCLVNVGCATTGFDSPPIDFIALLRATKSTTLLIQMCGRGMRLAAGKTECWFADFTDTMASLGPIDTITGKLPRTTNGQQGAPFKLCPECGSQNAAGAALCLDCGFEFPPPERIKHGAVASNAPILSSQIVPKVVRYPVDKVTYHCHAKPGSPDSLRVEYWSGLRVVAKEWVCFAHQGFAGEKARQWWLKRVAQTDDDLTRPPAATIKALELLAGYEPFARAPLSAVVPAFIHVNEYGKYPEIIRFEWETTA
jgi:DNA repair protein RadD